MHQAHPHRPSTREEIEAARDAVLRTIQEEESEETDTTDVERQRRQQMAPTLVSEDVMNAVDMKPITAEGGEINMAEAQSSTSIVGDDGKPRSAYPAFNVAASPMNMTAFAMNMKTSSELSSASAKANEEAGRASKPSNKLRQLLEAPKKSPVGSREALGAHFSNAVNAAFR